MEFDPTIFIPDGSTEASDQLPDINSIIGDILGPFMWVSTALTVLIVILYVYSMMRRRKLEKALLDIQKTLSEMNERDKARSTPAPLPKRSDDRIIALEQPDKAQSA